jgi:hypothetical protein
MKSKCLIGASHGPLDLICKGFPEHDKGRVKEAMEVLTKAKIIRTKSTKIGVRVSIEPSMIPAADLLIENKKSGIPMVDLWCSENERATTQE